MNIPEAPVLLDDKLFPGLVLEVEVAGVVSGGMVRRSQRRTALDIDLVQVLVLLVLLQISKARFKAVDDETGLLDIAQTARIDHHITVITDIDRRLVLDGFHHHLNFLAQDHRLNRLTVFHGHFMRRLQFIWYIRFVLAG